MANKGINGKGDKIIKRSGDTVNHYARVHRWIARKKGKANECENKDCNRQSNNFQWALLHGKKHEKNIDNYISLCRSCHAKYDFDEEVWKNWHKRDWSEEERMKLSLLNKGKKISEEHKKKLSHLFSGKGNPMYGKNKGGIEHPFYGKTHSIETKKKIAKINQSLSEEKINEIRWLYSEGVKQIDIANKFGISRASVCRIVNNKRYIL